MPLFWGQRDWPMLIHVDYMGRAFESEVMLRLGVFFFSFLSFKKTFWVPQDDEGEGEGAGFPTTASGQLFFL